MSDAPASAPIQSVPIDQITVLDDEHRALKPDHVRLYATLILKGRVLPPVMVRRTPNGATKFTLVAGRHRLEAHREAGLVDVPASIVMADRATAAEMTIEENLFRNDLSALERVDGVAAYRELFEARHGEIQAGRPSEDKLRQVGAINAADLFGSEDGSEEANFFALVSERLGVSRRQSQRFSTIAKRLSKPLHDALIGSTAENRLSVIDALSKQTQEVQNRIALLIVNQTGGDVDKAIEIYEARPKKDRQDIVYQRIFGAWTMLSTAKRRDFLVALGVPKEDAKRYAASGPDRDTDIGSRAGESAS